MSMRTLLLLIPLLASQAQAESAPHWRTLAAKGQEEAGFEVRARAFRQVDDASAQLTALADGARTLVLPLPEGGETGFMLTLNDLLPAELAAKYPGILTFSGQSLQDERDTGRFELGPLGFHGMFHYQGRLIFVDPLGDGLGYVVYDQRDALSPLEQQADEVLGQPRALARSVLVSGNERRRYVIAISASGEYTQYQGGSVAQGLAAIATLLNRVNEVYQRDLGVNFQLVANNDLIIYTNPATDPFQNDSSDMTKNQSVQTAALGATPFDIGHVLNTGGGGLAMLGSLCVANLKSQGMTGSTTPVGDAFFIDYVAHELGHQLGADHTFNGTTGDCGSGSRTAAQAWEPGSGSSIMGYAGLCGEESLQESSLPYFHSKSIEQMREHMGLYQSCGTREVLSNNAPQVAAGNDYVIPASTPFLLNGGGSDLDGDSLSYNWEQLDRGAASTSLATMVDDGSRPIFPFVAPGTSSQRLLPSLSSLQSGTLAKGEAWPTTNRTLHFRLTARDGKGGVGSDEMQVQVVNTGSPFTLTAPLSGTLSEGQSLAIRWQVAGSQSAPISCSRVDVALSADDGHAWSPLASAMPNSGSTTLTLPTLPVTSQGRLKLSCNGNIFFALSPRLSLAGSGSTIGAVSPAPTAPSDDSSGGGGGGSLSLWTLLLLALGSALRQLGGQMKLLLALGVLLLAGCQADASPQAGMPSGVETPGVAQALDEHLARGDHRVIIRAGRGQMVPGIPAEQQEAVKARCGMRYLEGLGDLVRPGQEAQQQALTDFAADYNRQMLVHCPRAEKAK